MMKLLVWFVLCFANTIGYVYMFCKFNDLKKFDKKYILLLCFGVIVQTMFKFYNVKYLTVLSYFIFYPILFYLISKFSINKILINTFIIWLIGVFLDLVSMILASLICYLFKINLNEYYNTLSICLTILPIISFFCIGYFLKVRNAFKKIITFFCETHYSDLPLILFCAFIFLSGLLIFLNFDSIHSIVFVFIILLLSLFMFVLLIKYRINSIETKKYLNTLKDNNDFYIKMDDENRIFKHNLMAKLSSIKSVSNKKAISLIDDFLTKTSKNISFSKKIRTVPYGLNGIIYQKTYPYLENINFKIVNKIDFDIFNVLKPRRYNVLVEKLVVSLDNAIEASLNSKNKIVVINLYGDENNIYVEIKNSFAHNIDVDNLGNLNYSTKGKKRGLGLFSILRDNEAVLKVKVVNNYFISLISVKKQK